MSRIAALARANDEEQSGFGIIGDLTESMQQRVGQMRKAVEGIGMLAMNARIEAENIGSAGLEFAGFTSEIGQTLRMAQSSLNQFTGELTGVGNHLHLAAASQAALAQQQAAASRSVSDRLAASIEAITDRGMHAVAAASDVARKSRQVGRNISDAVMALQIGDITRQRLEHVEYALRIVAQITAPAGSGGQTGHASWSALTDGQRDALVNLCARLLSAQLQDAADEFDREVRQILASVQELAADAQEILRLGNAAAGASGAPAGASCTPAGASCNKSGTFLGVVEQQVAEVSSLLDGLRIARRGADAVAMAVSEATTRLVSHTGTLNSLEEDIRFMGLNTSLKSGRLGVIGRPLMVIAQELRIYSNRIATEVGAVASNLDRVGLATACFSKNDQDKKAMDIEAVAGLMADSVTRLGVAGHSLADALATLARDTSGVAGLLRDTVARAIVHEELAAVLRQAADELSRGTTDRGTAELQTPETERVMGMFMDSYTMDRERIVHGRFSNGLPGATRDAARPPALRPDTPAELEDVLF